MQILSKVDRRQSKRDLDGEKAVVCDDGEESFAWNGKAYQLYTLYRDKDGNIRQVTDATDVLCAAVLKPNISMLPSYNYCFDFRHQPTDATVNLC